MSDPLRRAAAYIAARISSKQDFSSLKDLQDNKNYTYGCEMHGLIISVYDHSQNCHIKGSSNEGIYTLHHTGVDQSLTCQFKGQEFKGYDYATGHSYEGSVNDHEVKIYDNETNRYYTYLF